MTNPIEKFPPQPDKRQNARPARADALSKADRLFEEQNTQIDATAQPLAGPRFERQVVCVHALGPRPLAELLIEIANLTDRPDIVADRVEAFAALDLAFLRSIGGDRFPPMPLGVVR